MAGRPAVNPYGVRSYGSTPESRQQLAALVSATGRSQSQVIRDAIAAAHAQLQAKAP